MVFRGRYQTSLGARNAASKKSRSAENWKIAELLVFSGSLGKSEKSLGNSNKMQPETIDLNRFGVEQGSSFPIPHCFEEEAFGFWRSPFLLRRFEDALVSPGSSNPSPDFSIFRSGISIFLIFLWILFGWFWHRCDACEVPRARVVNLC